MARTAVRVKRELPSLPIATRAARDRAVTGVLLARSWLQLSVASLLVAGLFAVLVAAARMLPIPRFGDPQFFRVALVAHVAFSLNVWLLAFAACLWTLLLYSAAPASNAPLGWLGLGAAVTGAVLMAGTSFVGSGTPLLVDYVPVLAHPGYELGLLLLFIGVGITAAQYLGVLWRPSASLPAEARLMRLGAASYLAALVTFWIAWNAGLGHDPQALAWGGGHLLQVVNAAGLIAAWTLLSPSSLRPGERTFLVAGATLFLVPGVAVPILSLPLGAIDLGLIGAVTWASVAPPTVAAWALFARGLLRDRSWSTAPLGLLVSLALYAAGIAAALAGLEGDTRVTAHYHGTVGAVTVAYMALAYRLLPRLGLARPRQSIVRLQLVLYGGGLLLFIAGLFWAGALGATRKAFESFSPQAGLLSPTLPVLLGALAAVAGGALFVFESGIHLAGLRRTPQETQTADRHASPPTSSQGKIYRPVSTRLGPSQ
ncbi:MAG TPA: cbb3-type cytochrome c oxidase subunit I [Alphaproteobacteria bacterium]|nr:cbb3-type cytochrome c oxidase subunit I [Alphaproteobacteria bacterium]